MGVAKCEPLLNLNSSRTAHMRDKDKFICWILLFEIETDKMYKKKTYENNANMKSLVISEMAVDVTVKCFPGSILYFPGYSVLKYLNFQKIIFELCHVVTVTTHYIIHTA